MEYVSTNAKQSRNLGNRGKRKKGGIEDIERRDVKESSGKTNE